MVGKVVAVLGVALAAAALMGCATGVKGSPRRICYDAGYQPGTKEFSSCWKSVRNEMFKADAAAIGIGAAAALAAKNPSGIPVPLDDEPLATRSPKLNSSGQGSVWLCPNGNFVFGDGCYMAPDGTYVGATPRMAPNGKWVGGSPQIAPNGQYVGGTGPITMCPDGTYVAAPRCQLMPNGTYLGVP